MLAITIASCSKDKEVSTGQRLGDLISSFSKSILSAPNKLTFADIVTEYEDSIENFLWSNAPFVNWEGTLEAIDTRDEVIFGREATEVLCLIKTKINREIEGVYLFSFYKNDKPLTYKSLQECPIGSKVYFGFVPWDILHNDKLLDDILNSEFNMRGGLFYIGSKPQSYSDNTQRIVASYDSIRSIYPDEYIRIKDSVPAYYKKLTDNEQMFIDEFSSFRNIYDKTYPRRKNQ